MARWWKLFVSVVVLALSDEFVADAAVVQQTFNIGTTRLTKLCTSTAVTIVNGQLPGPTISVHEGDTVIIKVVNQSPYSISIHWHGIFQKLSAWDDGAHMITQCPIKPGNSFTYKFNIIGQEGTLWWHAHSSFLRATVYGALIILPKAGPSGYPFTKPYKEIPILLGEWWKTNVALMLPSTRTKSDAFTINGSPGDLYPCSKQGTYKLTVEFGETYLLRITNSALSTEHFFKVAGHTFTVVAVDASYTTPYSTDVIVIAPGQTVDALMVASATPSLYYMAAQAYISIPQPVPIPVDTTTATGIVEYSGVSSSVTPAMPAMPLFYDTPTANRFYTSLTGLVLSGTPTVPLTVNKHMFIIFGVGIIQGTGGLAFSMNNVSFQLPTKTSLLQAHFNGVKGIYTTDFPKKPPIPFDYTNPINKNNPDYLFTVKGTKVKKVKYNSVVEIVLQNTALISIENHPIHLHGFNFFVLAQGTGNYNPITAASSFNLVNPLVRNTIAVPVGGWAVIRFVANNPGTWFMHCHLDAHLALGLAMAFEVENGKTPNSILPPPPPDYPKC